jgi:hypothetical protein
MDTASKPTIVLATNSSDPALELRGVERYADGSGFCSEMFVCCQGFSALRRFHFSERSFRAALKALRHMDEQLQGEARLEEDYEHDQFLQFAVDSRGHVCVSGLLVLLDGRSNRLSFEFDTDQTCLAPLVRSLNSLNQ